MKFVRLIGVFIYILSLSSCATIRSDSVYSVIIQTEPKGATVKVTDREGIEVFISQSPDTVTLESGSGYFRKAFYLIEVSHEGYHSKKAPLYFKLDRFYIHNTLLSFFMPIGFLIVDPISGAMWEPSTQKIFIELSEN